MWWAAGGDGIAAAEDELGPALQALDHVEEAAVAGAEFVLVLAHDAEVAGGEDLDGGIAGVGGCEGGAA